MVLVLAEANDHRLCCIGGSVLAHVRCWAMTLVNSLCSNATVEYRSASRIGESDNDVNRKRIRALRKELEKKGWRSNR